MTTTDFEELLNKNIPDPNDSKKKHPTKIAFRNVAQKYANCDDCISFEGSRINTGRYNIGRIFGILYLACDIYGCLAELEYYSLKKPKFPSPEENVGHGLPRTFIAVKVEANKVLDLTDKDNLASIGIREDDLLEEWEQINYDFKIAKTQLIGKVAKEKGFEALLVPSARRKNAKSLNLLNESVKIEILNECELK